jgi:hypothetical protein
VSKIVDDHVTGSAAVSSESRMNPSIRGGLLAPITPFSGAFADFFFAFLCSLVAHSGQRSDSDLAQRVHHHPFVFSELLN